jgi:uncharacterized protein DUF4249
LNTRLAIFVLAAAATACAETTSLSPDANTLIVHAVLDPGVQHQIIVVQMTTGALDQQRQVTGAVVTIATPDGRTLTAVERRDTAAVTGFVPFPTVTTIYDLDVGGAGLIPGGMYQLRVVVPDGRTVTGRTTIPNAVPSTTALPTQTIDRTRDTVSIQWPRVAGARSYQVFVHSRVSTYTVFGDTSVALPGTAESTNGNSARCKAVSIPATIACSFAFVSGLTHQLAVIAVDENYFDYYRSTSDFSSVTGLVMHLDGGIGVFGSVVTVAAGTIVVK